MASEDTHAIPTRSPAEHVHCINHKSPDTMKHRGGALSRVLLLMPAICVVLVGVITADLRAQSGDAFLAQRLQAVLDSVRAAQGIHGISASVLMNGRAMWQGCSGESHDGRAITSDMQFGIGSNSKLFTAAVVLKLQERGLLDVDDSLHTWLPRYRNIDTTITLRQLLNHTSGLADVNNVPGYPDTILANPDRVFTREEVLRWVGPPHFAAGTSWEYSNTNYILAGMIAEKVAGRPFHTLLHEYILSPLSLDSTFFPVDDTVAGTIARPWTNGTDISSTPRNSLLSAAWCAGAMYSNSSEMAQWYQALFLGGALTDASLREMTTFVGSGRYGFGIAEKQLGQRTIFAHGGSIRGYTSQMFYDTTLRAVICVLTNDLPAAAPLVAQQLLAALIRGTATGMCVPASSDPTLGLYPNPARGLVHMHRGSETFRRAVLIDAAGRIQYHECADGIIDLSAVRPGFYLLRAIGAHGTYTARVIVR